ncbi:VOC family protein [Aestuariibacter sp. AA17]|uniref:VOC family protein n=1 Tax=Fluctibacter corallii TaxID=2984329 RepID=A0ABT3A4I7_9ALTE|nr:VOC family protein [Aestuariibacter sp. AA17]MCV2883502.1 VOC family protein [Aestuariibacter sp. AA17]
MIASTTLLVSDYDVAISWFTKVLKFTVKEDKTIDENTRFVLVAPEQVDSSALLLMKADSAEKQALVGKQAGSSVFLILHTNHFDSMYLHMKNEGVEFMETPRVEAYGKVVIFKDCFGNQWDLLEPAA